MLLFFFSPLKIYMYTRILCEGIKQPTKAQALNIEIGCNSCVCLLESRDGLLLFFVSFQKYKESVVTIKLVQVE